MGNSRAIVIYTGSSNIKKILKGQVYRTDTFEVLTQQTSEVFISKDSNFEISGSIARNLQTIGASILYMLRKIVFPNTPQDLIH